MIHVYDETDPDGVSVRYDWDDIKDSDVNMIIAIALDAFHKRGYNVTDDALKHNLTAWRKDLRGGYRDDANGYFLFSPCGCNPLSFNATKLVEGLYWQEKTYMV